VRVLLWVAEPLALLLALEEADRLSEAVAVDESVGDRDNVPVELDVCVCVGLDDIEGVCDCVWLEDGVASCVKEAVWLALNVWLPLRVSVCDREAAWLSDWVPVLVGTWVAVAVGLNVPPCDGVAVSDCVPDWEVVLDIDGVLEELDVAAGDSVVLWEAEPVCETVLDGLDVTACERVPLWEAV
jgi:hypothetical protein